jgi:hypothetical protein
MAHPPFVGLQVLVAIEVLVTNRIDQAVSVLHSADRQNLFSPCPITRPDLAVAPAVMGDG